MDSPVAARTVPRDPALVATGNGRGNESVIAGVSWGAVFAGAVTAAAVSMILLALGSGLGFASVSPWSSHNPSVTTVSVMAGVWLIVTHWIASGFAGYMAGRLRTKWVDLHTDEVFFRDTAHGFAAWAVAVLMVVGVGAFATTVGVGAASAVGAGAASNPAVADRTASSTDALFRTTQADTNPQANSQARAEAGRIIAAGVASGDVPAADRSYLAELVAARTRRPGSSGSTRRSPRRRTRPTRRARRLRRPRSSWRSRWRSAPSWPRPRRPTPAGCATTPSSRSV